MKLASLKEGGRDGTLIVVNRDLTRAVKVPDIAGTLQQALDEWDRAAPQLAAVYETLNTAGSGPVRWAGIVSHALMGCPPKPAKVTSWTSTSASPASTRSVVTARSCWRASSSVPAQNASRSAGSATSGR